MKVIHLLEKWALERRNRWRVKIDFQDNIWNKGDNCIDIIWVGCTTIAIITYTNIQFVLDVHQNDMRECNDISNPEFFEWFERTLIKAGLFTT